ncbi:MAG TPA: tripartite tricarboxylate transporter substrate-binding protein, partial [Burkholderiales bacterium]|nr:tripartite tricarboxylate transporter substrate-binding protein [Burkholderiales bacterium]
MNIRIYTIPLLLLLGTLLMPPSHAQSASTKPGQAFPNRPVRVLVPLSPGGGMDTVARGLAIKLGEAFTQTVVVDNRPGAGSQIALEVLAAAAPDGHTLMMTSLTPVTHPLLYKSRFDLLRDFQPVTQVTTQGYILTTHPSIPAKSVLEL